MAHLIDNTLGRDAFAFDARDGRAWHGLGTAIPADEACDPRKIAARAGAAYAVKRSAVTYSPIVDVFGAPQCSRVYADRAVLYRNDTGAPLGIVAPGYAIHQPEELFEAWRDELASAGLYISSAGVLKGGRVVFVCVKFGADMSVELVRGDIVEPFVTLATSFDGSMATRGVASTRRTVCDNTLQMNLSGAGRHYKQGHRGEFLPGAMKAGLGLVAARMRAEAALYAALAGVHVERNFALEIMAKLADLPADTCERVAEGRATLLPEDGTGKARSSFAQLMQALDASPGAQLASASGTAWGILNAATYHADHAARTRDTAGDGAALARVYSAQFGAGAAFKQRALELACAAAGVYAEDYALAA